MAYRRQSSRKVYTKHQRKTKDGQPARFFPRVHMPSTPTLPAAVNPTRYEYHLRDNAGHEKGGEEREGSERKERHRAAEATRRLHPYGATLGGGKAAPPLRR